MLLVPWCLFNLAAAEKVNGGKAVFLKM